MSKSLDCYKNIEILLATKHQKDQAISGPFYDAFGANLFTPTDFDTDVFGTFTGEIARLKTPYETVIEKASHAMLQYQYDYAIASEGSFGPHPAMFFVPADIELMSFIDAKRNLIVVESEVTTETNFAHCDLDADMDYGSFLKKVKFGSHGLIVKNRSDQSIIAKGVTLRDELDVIVCASLKKGEAIRLETDMRAMINPTRMKVINRLAIKLAKRLKQYCPVCFSPGFGKVTVSGKLPCTDCGAETELYHSRVLHCLKCEYHEVSPREDGMVEAEVQYCPLCNP